MPSTSRSCNCFNTFRVSLAVFLLTCYACAMGCIPDIHAKMKYKPIDMQEAEAVVRPSVPRDGPGRLGIIPFGGPSYARNTGMNVTVAYYRELLRNGLFSQITLLQEVPQDGPPWAYLKGFDMVLMGKVAYLLAATGDTPTQLTVEVQLMDVPTQQVIWYVRQNASSQAAQDLDLIWYTVPGERAQPYQVIASALGRQLSSLITPPPPESANTGPGSPAVPPPFIGGAGNTNGAGSNGRTP